jgi:carbonic anhydrase
MVSAADALRLLEEGNARFVAGARSEEALVAQAHRSDLVDGQDPFAVIVGCSDSRVPVELVFDRGLGDLFVIRVAGNVVAPSQIGSVEFAVDRFGTSLVVVLGHTHCGAVTATVEQLERPAADQSANLRAIVDRIRPAVEPLLPGEGRADRDALVRDAVQANVRLAAEQLRHGSQLIEDGIAAGSLSVVGAEYALGTGRVTFLDRPGSP